jgi:hypothetical protein
LKFRARSATVSGPFDDQACSWPGRREVSEHRIRLRGGWTCQGANSSAADQESITLPVRWDLRNPRRVRLSRRFGRPPIDRVGQKLFLELDHARGIQSLRLNGTIVEATSPARSNYLIEITAAPERNTLVIEVETGESTSGAAGDENLWGQIALLIRPAGRDSGM